MQKETLVRLTLAGLLAASGGAALAAPLIGAAAGETAKPVLALSPCSLPGVGGRAECGTLPVYENRAARAGRKVGLKVVVLRATKPPAAPDPVFILVGGPGESATEGAAGVATEFAAIRERRDIILVDQRGTGGSHPLNCDLFGKGDDLQRLLGDFFPIEAVRSCKAALEKDADLRLYTTPAAMDDLDDVRTALGPERINLVGGSYGTRAALVYMKRHPEHVRSAVLEGVAPTTDHIPLAIPRDAQRAFDGVLSECTADSACHGAFPNLAAEAAAVFARAAAGPVPAEVLHPATGDPVKVMLSRDIVGEAIRYMTYQAGTAGLVPVVIHEAAGGNFGPLAEFALFARREIVASGSMGMYLSVTCAEDLPFIRPGEGEKAAAGTFLGDYRLRQQRAACAIWPRGTVPDDFVKPIRSEAPALLIVGEWDPVTPPSLAEEAARTLPKGRVLVFPHGAHAQEGLEGAACLDGLVGAFLEHPGAKDLDVSCIAKIRRGPFPLTSPVRKVVPMAQAELSRFAGPYMAETIPMEARVETLTGKLRMNVPGEGTFLLVPVASDTFQVVGTLGFFVRFERTEGKPVRLHVTPPGGGEIVFVAKPVTPGP
jgi:pimeloyl-ACP methyl ester carboxylesterase